MKKLALLLICSFMLPLFTMAQDSIVGQWKMEVPDEQGNMVAIALTIKGDGSYTVDWYLDGSIEIEGNYEMDGSEITVWDTGGPNACESDKKGRYVCTIEGGKLTMEMISDDCEGRGGPDGMMTFVKA